MANIIQYTYTLECGHTVIANVADNDTSAYKMGDKVACPKDHYALKRINEVTTT